MTRSTNGLSSPGEGTPTRYGAGSEPGHMSSMFLVRRPVVDE